MWGLTTLMSFGISESSVSRIVHEVTTGILILLRHHVRTPSTIEELEVNAREFECLHDNQFTNCIGALDGVHFPIAITDKNTYSSYYNHSLSCMMQVSGYCYSQGKIKDYVNVLPNRLMIVG